MLENDIFVPLSKVFNFSIRTGTFKAWYGDTNSQKRSKLKIGDYRPIDQSLFCQQLISYLKRLFMKGTAIHWKFVCLYKYQFSFRAGHLTCTP